MSLLDWIKDRGVSVTLFSWKIKGKQRTKGRTNARQNKGRAARMAQRNARQAGRKKTQ